MSPETEMALNAGILALFALAFFAFFRSYFLERKEREELINVLESISIRLSEKARIEEAKNAEPPKRQLFPELFKKPEAK